MTAKILYPLILPILFAFMAASFLLVTPKNVAPIATELAAFAKPKPQASPAGTKRAGAQRKELSARDKAHLRRILKKVRKMRGK